MIKARKDFKAFGLGSFEWLDHCPKQVAGYWRKYQNERLLVLNNLSGEMQEVVVDLDGQASDGRVILSGSGFSAMHGNSPARRVFTLQPYQYLWLAA
jgi:hypothetical protein